MGVGSDKRFKLRAAAAAWALAAAAAAAALGPNAHAAAATPALELKMQAICPDIKPEKEIPGKFTCDGLNVNPTIRVIAPPADAKSLVVIVEDPDAPTGIFTHWVLFDVPVLTQIDEAAAPGRQALNDFGRPQYNGPCPPPGKPHRYYFKVYALDAYLDLPEGALRAQVEEAMKGHVLAQAQVIALFGRSQRR